MHLMDVSDGRASSAASVSVSAGKKRKRPVNACVTCRARKVKCDERPNGCLNCERLQLQCVQNGGSIASVERAVPSASGPLVGIKRRRTFRSCVGCRESKVKCSGDRPVCTRCRQKMATCVYDADVAEPAWVQSIAPTTAQAAHQEALTLHHQPPSLPRNPLASMTSSAAAANCPPSLAWLMDPTLPPKPRLHSLLEAYFSNVHPIRVFAFVHKPSFMRMLDEGLLSDTSDQALLHIMCALGARFFALDYHNSTSPLPKELIQSAGSQWAKIAEELFFSDYSTISITKLKVLVLLDDHEARTGNYAGSFLLTGLIVRMAHALQLNMEPSPDILFKNEPSSHNEVSWNESRRRLMWACYMVDVWAGSGVDHLTILSEKDIKLQLPCNERQFMLQIPCITEVLHKGQVLDFLEPDDIPEKPHENMGMGAYYVRIVSLWRRVLRFAKNMDDILPPWLPGSEFAQLLVDIQEWKNSLPSWLDFSSDNIYIRRESSQLGGLFLIHCMYHHVLCDLHRIALPDLFKAQEPFLFPFDQQLFMSRLQTGCFENAQRMSVLVSTVLQHGIKYFADPILPSFVYNSNRIMLFYIARILDVTKPDAGTVINRTVELVQQNNSALREMALLYPLAEPLCITTERWLETVRTSLARGHATTYIAPQDPSDASNQVQGIENSSASSTAQQQQQSALSVIPASIASVLNPTNAPDTYRFSPQQPTNLMPLSSAANANTAMQFEQPMFDLNDLHNFFEWESSAAENTQWTGFEGFNPLGWANTGNFANG